ncbi:MAG: acetylornithine deacetylase [Alphaproteobacteria bacterium]
MIARLVEFDTVSANSNLALIDFVTDYLSGHGVACRLFRNDAGDKANLYATLGPDGPGGIVLSGHTDVVPVAGQDWRTDPFRLIEKAGRLYGRGSCDMKGFIGAALALVPEFLAAPPRTPVHLALSYDEELGCRGVPGMIEAIVRDLPSPRLVIVGEPTEMTVANAHKGVYGFATQVTGLEGHSSMPERGASAIFHAARIVGFLDSLAAELRASGPRDAAFDPPWTTMNVGRIDGGTAVNIVPRDCRIAWEFRPVPQDDPAAILGRVEAFIADEVLPDLRAAAPDGAVVTRQTCLVEPLAPLADSPAEALVLYLTGANRAGAVAFGTEAGLFQKAGIPAVVCGPGSIEQAHKPDEFVTLVQIESCVAFLRRLRDWVHTEPSANENGRA